MAKAKSTKERMREYRKRLKVNNEKHADYLQKEKARYIDRKAKGKLKGIAELSARAQNYKRRQWKKNSKTYRANQWFEESAGMFNEPNEQTLMVVSQSSVQSPTVTSTQPTGNDELLVKLPSHGWPNRPISQSLVGRKKLRRDRTRSYRKIKKLEEQLKEKNKMLNSCRQRVHRLTPKTIKQSDKSVSEASMNFTPRSKTRHLMTNTSAVRKTLIFHHALIDEIKQKTVHKRCQKERQVLSKVLCGKILAKYKMRNVLAWHLGMNNLHRKLCKLDTENFKYQRKIRTDCITETETKTVSEFFERDDNSRMKPGKKDVVTKNQQKRQKRVLTGSIKCMHAKFKTEYPDIKISFAQFARRKPFWVRKESVEDRETCLCKIHDNTEFMCNRLNDLGVLTTKDMNSIMQQICCNTKNKDCMYRTCSTCKTKTLHIKPHNEGNQTWWNKWCCVAETREKKGKDGKMIQFVVKLTVKKKVWGSVKELLDEFKEFVVMNFCKHAYNIHHQVITLKTLRENLSDTEVVVHIDFSENYQCKLSTECQSFHFGASRNQVTLHTGVTYTSGQTSTFCTLSDSLEHGPAAIWAHLDPILKEIRDKDPKVEKLHIISDGPTTQYRNRNNFGLMTSVPYDMGFTSVFWIFHEAGHGKGAPDGVGGAIKRRADSIVSEGTDLVDAQAVFEALKKSDTSVALYFITSDNITEKYNAMSLKISAIPGTMKIHQAFSLSRNTMVYCNLSCYCSKLKICACHKLGEITFSPVGRALTTSSAVEATECISLVQEQTDQLLQPNMKSSAIENMSNPVAVTCLNEIDDDLIGKWVIVKYDNIPYPGIVQDVSDNSMEVKAMHKIGINRYFWPTMDDTIWYDNEKVLAVNIPPPTNVTSRHMKLDNNIFDAVCAKLE